LRFQVNAGNTDPACTLSPLHEQIFKQAATEAAAGDNRFIYRNLPGHAGDGGDHGALTPMRENP